MSSNATLGQLLGAARARGFVGRQREIDLFQSALGEAPPFSALYLHGPGGIGKSALVRQLCTLAQQRGVTALIVDGRTAAPGPEGVLRALGQALAGDGGGCVEDPLAALASRGRTLLAIDTYESLRGLDGWVREDLLPRLPAGTLVIIAGRDAPAPEWRSDAGWRDLMRVIQLPNLTPEESRRYLQAQGLPEAEHPAALAMTHGHPLALSLVAELWRQSHLPLEPGLAGAPDLVRLLLQRFVTQVPGPRERRALELCAHARVTTEALLREALDEPDAHALFEWLRGLSFVEPAAEGLCPHELARDALEADLKWRDPERHRQLHRQVRDEHIRRLQGATGLPRQRAALDLLFLHRSNPLMRAHYEWDVLGGAYAEPARSEQDRAAIVAMVHRHEGEAAAAIARHWLGRQPERFLVFRQGRQQPLGFAAHLRLDLTDESDRQLDPACAAAWSYMQRHAPLRPGEQALLHRFWMDREQHQAISPAFTLVSATSTLEWMGNPALGWCFLMMAAPERWQSVMSHIDFRRAEEADFEVAGAPRTGAFVHDWRVCPVGAWAEMMAARELGEESAAPGAAASVGAAPAPPAALVLSRPEFEAAVRQLLRDLHRPDRLQSSPLLRARVALDSAEARVAAAPPTPAVLQALVRQAAEALRADPRADRLYRALSATYLASAETQELAAERLGLPFGTYRHHLAQALERVTDWLWQRETGRPPLPPPPG